MRNSNHYWKTKIKILLINQYNQRVINPAALKQYLLFYTNEH